MATFTSRSEIEARIGARKVIELFDDDRDGALNDDEVAKLNEVISEANDITTGILLKKGWEYSDLNELAKDRGVCRAATQIASGLAGERRPEFYVDGEAQYAATMKRGEKWLRDFVKGDNRSRTEVQGAGVNQSLRGRKSISDPVSIFGRDPNDPNDKYGDGRGF